MKEEEIKHALGNDFVKTKGQIGLIYFALSRNCTSKSFS